MQLKNPVVSEVKSTYNFFNFSETIMALIGQE